MSHTLILDADGLLIKNAKRFSERYAKEFGVTVPMEGIRSFFATEFPLYLIGKADLKKVIGPHLTKWNWPKSVDDLLLYWFSGEKELDDRFVKAIKALRARGVRCYLGTNNEKYRTEYLVSELRLNNLLDGIFSSCTVGAQKSSADFWESMHATLDNPDKTEVILWDDDEENIHAAKAFGYTAHLYKHFSDFEAWTERLKQSTDK